MTRLLYARILIEVDLLLDLPSSVNVVLPNGTSLPQQIMYESLPHFCKQCKVLWHSTITCTKGIRPKHKTRPHETLACSATSSASAETAAVEKQELYRAGPSTDPLVDSMFTEVIATGEQRPQSPSYKRSKVATPENFGSTLPTTPRVNISEDGDTIVVAPPKRQYLTRSKVIAITCLGPQGKSKAPAVAFQLLHNSDNSAPSSTFWFFICIMYFDREVVPLVSCWLVLNCLLTIL